MKRLVLGLSMFASGCFFTCVARGAKVRTPRGERNIEELAVGDEVFAVNPDTGELVATKLLRIVQGKRECMGLRLGALELTCTTDHPLYDPDAREWAVAGDWALGRRTALLHVREEGGVEVVRVTKSTSFAGLFDVFDLTVEHELHTFVANGLVVHNKSPQLRTCTLNGAQVMEFEACTCASGEQGTVDCVGEAALCSSCADAGTPGDAGTSAHVVQAGCPRVLLRGPLPQTFSGDTSSLANSLTSARLEWTDAPDDSLEFTAPETGNYVIELTSTVTALGVSAQDYNTNGSDAFPFTRAACPMPSAVKEINGVYNHNQPTSPLALTAGQSVVLFVSAPSWATVRSGPYTLTVRKLP